MDNQEDNASNQDNGKVPSTEESKGSAQESCDQSINEASRSGTSTRQGHHSSLRTAESVRYSMNADLARLSSLPVTSSLDRSLSSAGHMQSLRTQDALGLSTASLLGSFGSTSTDLPALAAIYLSLNGLASSSGLGLSYRHAQGTSDLISSLISSQAQREVDAAAMLQALGTINSRADVRSGIASTQVSNRNCAPQHSDLVTAQQLLAAQQLLQQQRFNQQQLLLQHDNFHQVNPLLLTQLLQAQELQQKPTDYGYDSTSQSAASLGIRNTPSLNNESRVASAHPAGTTDLPATGVVVAEPERKRRTYRHESFPMKLHRLLIALDAEGKSDIACFVRDGTAFRILQPELFQKDIIPKYFRHTKLRSFSRQLNMYGFIKIYEGPNVGAYQHPLFVKSRPDLCKKMERVGEGEPK